MGIHCGLIAHGHRLLMSVNGGDAALHLEEGKIIFATACASVQAGVWGNNRLARRKDAAIVAFEQFKKFILI